MWAGLKLYSNLRRVDLTFSYISSGTRCVPWCFQILCYICEEIFTTLSFKVCVCELCEPQCICVAAGVAVVSLWIPWWYRFTGRVSLKGRPPFICITSFHPFSQFFSGGHLRFIREAINPLHTMSSHWFVFRLTFPLVWRKWRGQDVTLHYSLVSSSRIVLGSQNHGAESTQRSHLPLLSKQAQPSLAQHRMPGGTFVPTEGNSWVVGSRDV